jgi:hypothetical protein
MGLAERAGAYASITARLEAAVTRAIEGIVEQVIAVPARIARSARKVIVHLPRDWPWESAWTDLHHVLIRPPPPLAPT